MDAQINTEAQCHSSEASIAAIPGYPSLSSRPLFIIAAASFAVVFPFFFLGVLAGHDFTFHMNSWMEALAQWKQGIIYPRWAALANYGYGDSRFIFYPPVSWILGAALGSVLPWKLVPGAYVWLVLTLSGCSMFFLARRWFDRRSAIFAAALYAANPYHLVIVYWRSDFSELLAGALLPLLLLTALGLDEEGSTPVVRLGLVVAAAWLTNAPAAVMVNYSLMLLLIVIAVVRRSPRVLFAGGMALALGASLAAAYILPAAYERGWVNISQVLAAGLRPQDNFLFTTMANPGHDAFNRLLSLVSVSEIMVLAVAFGFARRWRQDHQDASWALAAWAGAAALLMFTISSAFWVYLPLLHFLQFPWRCLLCFNVAFALLVGAAWQSNLIRGLICVGMLGILIFGAWRIQRPWKATAADIALMEKRQRDEQGYKGRPEYVPLAASIDSLDESAPRVMIEGDSEAQVNVQHWEAESKAFTVSGTGPGNLVLRLFNYPAWRVEVNGLLVESATRPSTGQMMIPVQGTKNRVRISFARTWDRTLGGMISLASIVVLLFGVMLRQCKRIASARKLQVAGQVNRSQLSLTDLQCSL